MSVLAGLALALWAAADAPAWRPTTPGTDEARVEELARRITRESILGADLDPLMEALPSRITRSARRRSDVRERLLERRRELRRRLGTVHDWEVAEVLRDERGRIKVRISLFASPARRGHKRAFRGVSYVFAREGADWRLAWIGYWDAETGSWDVLEGEIVSGPVRPGDHRG